MATRLPAMRGSQQPRTRQGLPCDGTGPGGRGCSWEVGGPRGGPGGRRQGEGGGGGGQAGGGHGREWSLESQTVNLAGVSGVQVLSLELPTNKGTKS